MANEFSEIHFMNQVIESNALDAKNKIKSFFKKFPSCFKKLKWIKENVKEISRFRFFLTDLKNVYKYAFWVKSDKDNFNKLSAKLLFNYHKIEKGLCMPSPKEVFGVDVVETVLTLLEYWVENQHDINDPVYLGAIDALNAYYEYMKNIDNKQAKGVKEKLNKYFDNINTPRKNHNEIRTPLIINEERINSAKCFSVLQELFLVRRSYRNYSSKSVEIQEIKNAISLAQLSPSVCNRQSCKVHVVHNKSKMQQLLSLQNGNKGFGSLASHVLIITADLQCFVGVTERNQPFIDGGLFSMSLIYALQAQGIVSCCLNWCVEPKTDILAHNLLDIDQSEQIIMFIAVGYPNNTNRTPLSERRSLSSVLKYYN